MGLLSKLQAKQANVGKGKGTRSNSIINKVIRRIAKDAGNKKTITVDRETLAEYIQLANVGNYFTVDGMSLGISFETIEELFEYFEKNLNKIGGNTTATERLFDAMPPDADKANREATLLAAVEPWQKRAPAYINSHFVDKGNKNNASLNSKSDVYGWTCEETPEGMVFTKAENK